MIDFEIMIKDLRRLAWIPRLPEKSKRNWKTVPEHFLKDVGVLIFSYGVTSIPNTFVQGLPKFYKDILTFFDELKSLYR